MKLDYLESVAQISDDSDSTKSPTIPEITPQIEADGATLSDILNSGDGLTTFGISATSPVHSVDLPAHTLSNVLLQRADSLGLSFREKMDHVQAMIKAGPEMLSLAQIFDMQVSMSAITLEMDLVSGGVHKVTQSIDQLSKLG